MFGLRASISTTLIQNTNVRAEYLHQLFMDKHFKPQRYIDLGAQCCSNAITFGKNCPETLALDMAFPKQTLQNKRDVAAQLVLGDVTRLPFQNGTFDMVTVFSILQIVDPKVTVEEALRILKANGRLLIQVPNRYFPLDVHTGLPFINYLPRKIREYFLCLIGYEWMKKMNIPTPKQIIRSVKSGLQNAKITIQRIIYPTTLIPSKFRTLAKIAAQIGIFSLFPYGYLITITDQSEGKEGGKVCVHACS
jgi:SAM-dependent methyltransferase